MVQIALDLVTGSYLLEGRRLLLALGHHVAASTGKDTAFGRINRARDVAHQDDPLALEVTLG